MVTYKAHQLDLLHVDGTGLSQDTMLAARIRNATEIYAS